ncbi:acetyl-CoA synthetase-like protein [Armillaria solidipes]|uniref:Acetyl-CoA synthetase-like protein n=1 Tax=Armillaria solidipes TaxID=1076256 RepID=A0A2H3C1T8_9AGAR|nr:acetyl-CoA synthetase-like protein [Armillaria solidipes]
MTGRPCVIQSLPTLPLSDPQEKITYSYGAIRRASNILAHRLLKGGIKREEVVMVYAHRSVDLVVAVMAMLKAGATFSVIVSIIDPAYPASHQIIYLRVTQPRGLIVLKGAGIIAPSMCEFISTDLKIRVEVPALEIKPDGGIFGGAGQDDVDILHSLSNLAETDPNIVLGPDSIGTLSFTSGSTGIPRACGGIISSGLNENSKFTMLSGITHDPIQHDTMGQLLSAEATRQIPSLRNAFFVGDVLTNFYLIWRRKLEQHIMEVRDNALYPLLHFVLDDLPTSTKAPDLDDTNTTSVLSPIRRGYLVWFVRAGFLPSPMIESLAKTLPILAEGVVKAAGWSGA